MAKCPKCNNIFTYWQIVRHNRRNPIICKTCGAKFRFDKKWWYKNTISIGVVATIFMFFRKGVPQIILYILLIILTVIFFIALNSPKLEIVDKQDSKTSL